MLWKMDPYIKIADDLGERTRDASWFWFPAAPWNTYRKTFMASPAFVSLDAKSAFGARTETGDNVQWIVSFQCNLPLWHFRCFPVCWDLRSLLTHSTPQLPSILPAVPKLTASPTQHCEPWVIPCSMSSRSYPAVAKASACNPDKLVCVHFS